MRLVVFGLSVSSSRGNGHATRWRGLARALARAGHPSPTLRAQSGDLVQEGA
jgi:hypothetical protein